MTAATLGLSTLESVVATCKEGTAAVQAVMNSTDGSDSSPGAVFLQTSADTHDVYLEVIGR